MKLNEARIKRFLEGNPTSNTLPYSIDEFLQDIAQMYGGISYSDIGRHDYSEDDIRKLSNIRRRYLKWGNEMMEDEFEEYVSSKILPDILKIFGK